LIELIVMDVDGCMTDGGIIYSSSGDELKIFNVKDGFAIASWKKFGKKTAIITGRNSLVVKQRAEELGIDYLFQNTKDKFEALLEVSFQSGISLKNMAAIGDDLNDYKVLKNVGISFAPYDAVEFIRKRVDVVLEKEGGRGAIREMIEHILKEDGLYDKFLKMWIGEF